MKISAISNSFRRVLVLLTVLAVTLLGTWPAAANSAQQEAETPPAEPATAAAEGEQEASDDEPKVETLRLSDEFNDREWILDEETGRRFTIEKVPKRKGAYRWEDENHIRLPGGLFNIEVVDHNDQWFWIKIFDRERRVGKVKTKDSGPSAEELEAVKATYSVDTETVDRVHLEDFGKGLPRRGQWRNGFDVADMNGDGHLDIVFGPARKGRAVPNIFLGDSAGQWTQWRDVRYPDLAYDYGDVVAGDWNGDGHTDMAFGVHMRGMLSVVNDGKGGFEPWGEGIAFDRPGSGRISAFSSRSLDAVDWNGDGRLDLIALGEGPKGLRLRPSRPGEKRAVDNSRGILIYLNQGDGSWQEQRVEEANRDFGDDFAVGDLNGDGRLDVVVASSVQNNHYILRSSQPTGDQLGIEKLEGLRPRIFTTEVASADLDKDGRQDLVVAFLSFELKKWRTGIDVFFGREEGWERRPLLAEEDTRKGFFGMDLGDVDGDGFLDLAAVSGEGETLVFLGEAGGFFHRELTPELSEGTLGCKGWDLYLVDLDKDSKAEVVASFAGERTGPEMIPQAVHMGCPGKGRIQAWKVMPGPLPEKTSAADDRSAP